MSLFSANSSTFLTRDPIVFDDFFELGQEETVSPFITPNSRMWGANLTLKSAIFAAFLLLLSFILSFSTSTQPLSQLFLVAVYFFAGVPALIESIEDLLRLDINIDILMTVAAFSSVLIGSSMEGALLLVLFALSGSMEDAVTSKAKSSISNLHKLSPTKATVISSDGTLLERAVNDIAVGTTILIKSGQIVPLDGIVIDGISSVNLVHLTGENFPVTKTLHDTVQAGARNLEGSLTLTVTHASADSTLTRIIRLITQAQESRPALQRWFDKLSRAYALTIILLAAFFSLTLPFLLKIPFLGIEGSLYRSLAFLIAASPCALIIAIPIAYLSAVSACAKRGILLKGGITLDALASCATIALDKTGTLTTGDLSLVEVEGITDNDPKAIQQANEVAYALEKNAVHPIAKAIVSYNQEKKSASIPIKNFSSLPGFGLTAQVQLPSGPVDAYIGRLEYIIDKIPQATVQVLKKQATLLQEKGELLAVLLLGQQLFLFRFRDTLRAHMAETVADLQESLKMRLLMLTGDHENSAARIAREIGLKEYRANLTPEDKLNYISKLSQEQGLIMVGDGINDAPALARATVGICMGKVGNTTAMDAADVILLQDNIELLGWLMRKSHQTVRIVKQNLFLAAAAILIASLPALAGIVPLWLAVVLHEGGTVLVGLNGLRLLWR